MATAAEKQGRPKADVDGKRGILVTTFLSTRRAASFDLDLELGRDNAIGVTWLDGDVAGVRDLTSSAATLTFHSVAGGTAHVTLGVGTGLMLAAYEPNIAATISAAQVSALASAFVGSRGWYELVIDGVRLLEGCVAVRK